ncbi:hypothetical protein LO772_07525 [Yinghuangia sp. ASG 101]|uniref:hypothetical protein n=1 Tax=Yinghuangia sp. ASG 101 TaxID=2896848 RepID=UPI001E3B5841|nr:hypothetical protein [Yinghuangia sp. ASG 101]UGQ13450.1 hypothetical protein LO772_07525 [Yinghuangia sp. ASG 101]
MPDAVVLSHDEQLRRLADGCPDAVSAAVVAGDPCLDDLHAALPLRDDYRDAWGLLPGQKLVAISSTWSQEAQFGKSLDIVRHTVATLPRDEYKTLAIIHPNVWYAHSTWQIRSWLAPLQAAGLTLVRPEGDGWKAALVAADAVVGDYGSVTFYGAAIGVPTLLSGRPAEGTLADDSPIARLLPLLPRVDPRVPLTAQIQRAVDRSHPDPRIADITALASSVPGGSSRVLRTLFYDRMNLPEPSHPAAARPVELPDAETAFAPRRTPVAPPTHCTTDLASDGSTVTLRRYPTGIGSEAAPNAHHGDSHLVADAAEPDERLRLQADVIVGRARPTDASPSPEVEARLTALLRTHPGSWLAALPLGRHGCLVGTPTGWRAHVTWTSDDPRMTTAVAASAVYATLPTDAVPDELRVRLGPLTVTLTARAAPR